MISAITQFFFGTPAERAIIEQQFDLLQRQRIIQERQLLAQGLRERNPVILSFYGLWPRIFPNDEARIIEIIDQLEGQLLAQGRERS